MGGTPVLKKPKLKKDDYDFAYWPRPSSNGSAPKPLGSSGPEEEEEEKDVAEEAVLALIAHRERDVERCKLKLLHHQSLLDTAEKKLAEAQSQLARYQVRAPDHKPPPPSQRDPKLPPPDKKAPTLAPQPTARPQLVIPGANTWPAPRPGGGAEEGDSGVDGGEMRCEL